MLHPADTRGTVNAHPLRLPPSRTQVGEEFSDADPAVQRLYFDEPARSPTPAESEEEDGEDGEEAPRRPVAQGTDLRLSQIDVLKGPSSDGSSSAQRRTTRPTRTLRERVRLSAGAPPSEPVSPLYHPCKPQEGRPGAQSSLEPATGMGLEDGTWGYLSRSE